MQHLVLCMSLFLGDRSVHRQLEDWPLASPLTEVLTVMLLKIQVFWDVTLCSWASSSDVSEDHPAFMFSIK